MKRKTYSCGGIGSYEGSCGASDCPTCHPEWQGRDEEAEDAAACRADWERDRRKDEESERGR